MIAIVDNHLKYTSHCIYFVEVPPQCEAAFVAAFAGNTGPEKHEDDDGVGTLPDCLPYLLGTSEQVEWLHGNAMPLTEFVSDMDSYHHKNDCENEVDTTQSCTCWVSKLPRP